MSQLTNQYARTTMRMRVDNRKGFRFTDDDVARIKALAERWGGIEPLSDTGVIREALKLAVGDNDSVQAPRKSVQGATKGKVPRKA